MNHTLIGDGAATAIMSPERDDGGQFAPQVTDRDVLRALSAHPQPVATAGDLAGRLGVSAESVRRHLSALHEDGRVERKSVGARAVVWWVETGTHRARSDDPIPAGDPFFDAEPFAIEAPVDEADIDDVVYGESGG